jgi:hypothetical protein
MLTDLEKINDRELLERCLKDPNINKLCSDEKFWKNRYKKNFRYPIRKNKEDSWKKLYLEQLINLQPKDIPLLLFPFSMPPNRRRIINLLWGSKRNKYEIGNIPLRRDGSINTKILDNDKIKYPNMYIFIPMDIYANTNPEKLQSQKEFLNTLENYGKLLPERLVTEYLSSKKYTKDFKDFMLPTMTYPEDFSEIARLPVSNYMVKYGYSGANWGNYKLDNISGSDILEFIENNKSNRYSSLANPNFAIVQPTTDLFRKCEEYRILVIDGEIAEIYYGWVNFQIGTPEITNDSFRNNTHRFLESGVKLKINPKIYYMIEDIYKRLTETTGINPILGLRIDMVLECSDNPTGNFQENILPDVFNPNWNGNLYLNEIDTISSGVWGVERYNTSTSEINSVCHVQIENNQVESFGEVFVDPGEEPDLDNHCDSEKKLVKAILKRLIDI